MFEEWSVYEGDLRGSAEVRVSYGIFCFIRCPAYVNFEGIDQDDNLIWLSLGDKTHTLD